MAVRPLIAACLCTAFSVASAQPVDISVGTDNRTISFDIPDAAFARDGLSLAIDLDGYDVTGFARIDGTRLIVELDVPLTAGEHALILYAFRDDGSTDALVDVALELAPVSSSEWSFNSVFESNYRASEDPGTDFDGVDSVANSGSISYAASNSTGNWGSGLSLETIYDRASGDVPGGKDWLLPSYEFYLGYAGESRSAWLVAGNIALSQDDLLFSAYQRRGTALEATAGRFEIKAFTVNSELLNGYDGSFFLPLDSREKSKGIASSFVVVEKRLELGGGFVEGKSAFGGAGYNLQGDPTLYGGNSWNLSADSRWLENSLWIHVEHAESDFDFDGLGTGQPSSTDDATQAMLQLSSSGALGTGPFEYWSAVLQHRRIGHDYYSLGNLSLPGNIEANSAWLQAGFTSMVVDIELSREQTNPDSDPLFVTQTLERSGLSIAWTPVSLDPDSGLWKALGAPSVSAWTYRSDSSQPDSEALLAGFDVDNETDEAGIALSFARDELSWSIEYGTVDYDDQSATVIDNGFIVYEPYSDSRNRSLSLTAGWLASDRVSLEAYLQRNTLEETDFDDAYHTTNVGVSGNFVLVPDKLGLFASFSRGKDRSTFGDPQFLPERFVSDYASLQLNWKVRDAQGARPSLNLFFKGNYGRNENLGLMLDADFWAVYLGGSMNWMRGN